MDLELHDGVDLICDAQYLPFRDQTFAEISANQVLEHLHAPLLSLKEWKRVLKDSGRLDLCIPNATYYRRIIRYVMNKPISQNEDHIQCFTRSEILNMLRIVGLKLASYHFLTEYWRQETISRFNSIFKHLTNRQLRFILIKGCEKKSQKARPGKAKNAMFFPYG